MGFLDSSTAVIEAVLTDRGRQILIEDPSKFKITKFALGDDDIDYSLTESEIEELLVKLDIAFSKEITTKESIVKIMKDFLVNFDHKEIGKTLDSKM